MKKLITVRITLTTTLLIMMAPAAIKGVRAQGRGGPPAPPASPRAGARIDITGYWVSLITEDWRYRQFTPPKGDYVSVPLNPAGKKIADAWDPAKDEAAGEQCRAYGAAGVMRAPGRIHVTWQDDNTLKMDTEAGTQSRLLHFGGAAIEAAAPPSWQGSSAAGWEFAGGRRGRGQAGDLKVVTT